ncbi:MAG: CaiB/BaiF CoA transferase family protein [Sphingobium sp.]
MADETRDASHSGPLSGIRVLDLATFIAAPFCGTILGEFGAEVIKVEQPGVGDSLRRFGTPSVVEDSYVWLSEARNKQSMTIDLRTVEGAVLIRKLVAHCDVLLENFRPGTLEGWGLDYESLAAINPRLVMLRVSAYGQTGPLRERPGFARIAHAFGGLAHLAGEPGGIPVVPGSTSLADYASGLFGAVGVLAALRHAERTGQGQVVDLALYESIFRIMDEMLPAFAATGFVRQPMGADTVNVAPHSHYRSAQGDWIAIACTNDRMWRRLARAMQRPDLADDLRFAHAAGRVANLETINGLVADWVGALDTEAVLDLCETFEVPASRLMTIADIHGHPQYAARENILLFDDGRAGLASIPAPVPRLSRTPAAITSLGPALGEDTADILARLLDLSAQDIARLRAKSVI